MPPHKSKSDFRVSMLKNCQKLLNDDRIIETNAHWSWMGHEKIKQAGGWNVWGVSALHFSTGSQEFGGVSVSGFSACTAPTYYHTSKYFYNQWLEVSEFNLELSVALIEERVEVRLKVEYFWKFGNQSSELTEWCLSDQRSSRQWEQ